MSVNMNEYEYLMPREFDSIDHEILWTKLNCLGIKWVCSRTFSSYSSNRKYFVSMEGSTSGCLRITMGAVQGSILGRLLFSSCQEG